MVLTIIAWHGMETNPERRKSIDFGGERMEGGGNKYIIAEPS